MTARTSIERLADNAPVAHADSWPARPAPRQIRVGDQFNFEGDTVTVVKIFPPHPSGHYRCSYSNGHCVDLRASELRTGRTA